MDPLAPDYPWYTPYQFAGNTPIYAIDLDGAEPLGMTSALSDSEKEAVIRVAHSTLFTPEVAQLLGETAVGLTPVGWTVDVKDIYYAYSEGDGWGIAFGVVGFLPLVGDVAKSARKAWKAGKKVDLTVDQLKKLDDIDGDWASRKVDFNPKRLKLDPDKFDELATSLMKRYEIKGKKIEPLTFGTDDAVTVGKLYPTMDGILDIHIHGGLDGKLYMKLNGSDVEVTAEALGYLISDYGDDIGGCRIFNCHGGRIDNQTIANISKKPILTSTDDSIMVNTKTGRMSMDGGSLQVIEPEKSWLDYLKFWE